MNLDIGSWILAGVFVCIVGGMLVGGCKADEHWQEQAVKVGVAEYYLDSNHNRQFRWKTNGVMK